MDSGDLTGATALFVLWMEMPPFVSSPCFSDPFKRTAGSDQDWRRGRAGSGGTGQALSSYCGPADGHQQSGGQGVGPDGGSSQCPLHLGMLAGDASAGAILEFLCCTFEMKGKQQKEEKR